MINVNITLSGAKALEVLVMFICVPNMVSILKRLRCINVRLLVKFEPYHLSRLSLS